MMRPSGFTLLEVMVSLFVLALVLFGVTAAEIKALRTARGVMYFNRAAVEAENMAAFMLAHGGDGSSYLQQWQRNIQQDLPASTATVSGLFAHYTITIKWGGYDLPCHQNQAGLSGCVMLAVAA